MNESKFSDLTLPQQATGIYLAVSLCLFAVAETSIAAAVLVALNLCVAAILNCIVWKPKNKLS